MTKRRWVLSIITTTIVLLGVFAWLWLARPLLPSDIRRQVSFVVFVPGRSSPALIDRSSIKYDDSKKILTYTATIEPARLIMTNQATPDEFKDIPAAYDKVVASMHPYANFDSANGKVSLTRHERTGNQQVAIANHSGTLMFVRTDHDLTQDQWRQFFNKLTTHK